ncbi:MAG: hypothetical protein ACN4GR_11990 [Arenicellales bacterium]
MLNKKVIVVSGFPFGGTNVIWNLLQSHPDVCSAGKETNELLYPSRRFRSPFRPLLLSLCNNKLTAPSIERWMDRRFYRAKMNNINNQFNQYMNEKRKYTRDEIASTALCLKSLHWEIDFNPTYARMYDEIYFVGVVRNGYAWCEGWMRRGGNAKTAGEFYQQYSDVMLNQANRLGRYKFIKLEDALTEPFGIAEELYKFTQLEPTTLPKLRLKSKKVISDHGNHEVRYGNENSKYWFDRDEIKGILDPGISDIQAARLDSENRAIFSSEALSALKKFGYV